MGIWKNFIDDLKQTELEEREKEKEREKRLEREIKEEKVRKKEKLERETEKLIRVSDFMWAIGGAFVIGFGLKASNYELLGFFTGILLFRVMRRIYLRRKLNRK